MNSFGNYEVLADMPAGIVQHDDHLMIFARADFFGEGGEGGAECLDVYLLRSPMRGYAANGNGAPSRVRRMA